MKIIIAMLLAAAQCSALAAELPAPGQHDPRVRYITYKKDEVTVIYARRGTVTRIVLGDDEKIIKDGAATGFPSDCSKADLEWCVRADVGANQIWLKPKDNATYNNLELKTDKRDYSFDLRLLSDTPTGSAKKLANRRGLENEPMFRVIFRYPMPLPSMAAMLAMANTSATPVVNEKAQLEDRLALAAVKPANWRYSMQVLKGSQDIAPAMVFDDGRFTYFRFPANREVPTIYHVSPSGEESRISYHVDDKDDELVVVERMGRRFVLRLGEAVVGIWNDAFDPNGVPPQNGTTVDGVSRVIREGK
ncbi:TrbG/VirB9 family P-type conjugative transfer protein [Massilia pseudoviolaceinigra]|uniref:TrbG/VirB9 family P-type conjugative transfer protein n=1 Tax=Massilia pseudoviolaceinigra TaxID=3057165 RepID=UPI0027965094|nr:TrbG/VirB9 family P-type conjugative transfer protein [Massilia sp. CCM 9206]MDQ1922676.1 TrbG/VirB9 family P-type conjugative transfer protein [Massilia sp. CCM 9206]